MPVSSTLFSNLMLCLTGLFIFFKYVQKRPKYDRHLWGIFLLTTSFTALTEVLNVMGLGLPDTTTEMALSFERTVGAVAIITGAWCLIMHYQSGLILFIATLIFGLVLFWGITRYHVPIIGLIIQPFCLIVTLLICCIGLAGKQKSALWLIFSMMLIALAAKSREIPIPLDPIDLNRYLMVVALLCVGYALRDDSKTLF